MTWKEFPQHNLFLEGGSHYRLWLGEALEPSKYVEHCHSSAEPLLSPSLFEEKKLSFSLHFCLQLQQLHFWPRKSCTTLNHSPIHRRVALFHFLKFPLSQQTISPSSCFFPLNFSPFTPSSPVSWFYPHPLFPLFPCFSPPPRPLPPPRFLPVAGFPLKICKEEQTNVVMSSNAMLCHPTPCHLEWHHVMGGRGIEALLTVITDNLIGNTLISSSTFFTILSFR